MSSNITLSADNRNTLLDYYRAHPDPQLRLRAHLLLLLADGYSWATIAAVLYCSTATIARWQARFLEGGLAALGGRPRGRASARAAHWAAVVVHWVLSLTPRAFGFLRSRWCCAVLALALWQRYRVEVSRETIRRWLRQHDLVWRRPRPVLRRPDPRHEPILEKLRDLLLHLPDDETVVFEDEVDLNLNPDLGGMWMRRGQQAEVVTPGDNAKRYLAGSLHWRTGVLLGVITGPKRDGKLFVRHLHELRRRLRRYRVIHVICDNAKFHGDCWEVWEFCLQYGERVQLHFLPKYAPKCNPIERVWWHLREEITRCHTCQTIEELVTLGLHWLTDRRPFAVEDSVYHKGKPRQKGRSAAA